MNPARQNPIKSTKKSFQKMHKKLYIRKKVWRTMMDFRNLQKGKAAINTFQKTKRFLNNNIHHKLS